MSASNNKLALCLSGGGFRASFYHIGILARMAELGMLKQVEVISTVSGGSIVGAAYYMKLKALLEKEPDNDIRDQQYVELVKELEDQFLAAVQKNLRMRTFANPFKNMRMALPSYSRSDAIGEVYEKYIYQKIIDDTQSIYRPVFKRKGRCLSIRDMLIHPNGDESFHPHTGNASRTHKVPILILNATSLNSGHNWYFSATSLGEVPPRNKYFRDIDKKDRYRRIRYEKIDANMREQDFCLGKAVAASAGVPGLFPPMAVSNLYPGRRVQLVDGGVFDNQGISGALHADHRCNCFVVSDASGQSDADDNPDTGLVKVLSLTSSIMMGRVREEIVNYLEDSRTIMTEKCEDAEDTYKISYMHLMRGIIAKNINAYGQAPSEDSDKMMASDIKPCDEDFNVKPDMQYALAHVRTDLDSFTELEAGSLSVDAYLMSNKGLQALAEKMSITAKDITPVNWRFKPFDKYLASGDEKVLKHLSIGNKKFFKPFIHLTSGTLGWEKSIGLLFVSIPFLACLLLIAYLIHYAFVNYFGNNLLQILLNYDLFNAFLVKIGHVLHGLIIAFIISSLVDKFMEGGGKLLKVIRTVLKGPAKIVTTLITRFALPFLGAIPVWLYINTIDKYYIEAIEKLYKES